VIPKTIRAGIVGLGVGEAHLRSYMAIPGCDVAMICDVDPVRLAEIGDRYGIGSRSVDYKAVTEHPDIDVVSICSYDDVHAAQLISALRNGKHVMVEKPFVLHRGGIHLVDLMRWLMGREITEVCAMGTDILTRGSRYRWPDTISALLKWEGGATGKCTATLGPKRTKFHALNVFGTKATFVNDMPHAKIFTGDDIACNGWGSRAWPNTQSLRGIEALAIWRGARSLCEGAVAFFMVRQPQ
jgi:predicted dehydrogenase